MKVKSSTFFDSMPHSNPDPELMQKLDPDKKFRIHKTYKGYLR